MDDIPLAVMVKKLKSGSAKQKGKTGRRKSENDDKEDNSLKVQVSKKVDKDNVVGEEDAGDSPIRGGSEDTLKSVVKFKRGADGEMMQAYLSSAEKDLSRCRPRKEVPLFRMVDLSKHDRQRIMGKRIKVYWPESRKWFLGCVQSFDRKRERHNILYDDGDKETLDLTKERFELEILPSEGFNLKFESRSHKKVGSFNGSEASENALDDKSSKASDDKNSSGSPGTENISALEKVCQTGENEPFDMEPEMELSDSKGVAEIANEVKKKLEAQVEQDGGPDTNIEGKTTMSNSSVSEDKKTEGNLEDESDNEGGTRQGKISSRRKAISCAPKRRKVNLVIEDVRQEIDKMETDAHDVEYKLRSVQGGEAAEDNHQMVNNEIPKESENEVSMLLLPQAAASCQNITSSEGGKLIDGASDEIGNHAKMEITSADTVNVSSNVAVAVVTVRMVQDKVPTEEIKRETAINISSEKDEDGKPSIPIELIDEFIEEPSDLQSTIEVIPNESSPGNMQGKLDAENTQPGKSVAVP